MSKSNRTHSFDTELATLIGIEKAIIVFNIDHWCTENELKGNPEYLYFGSYWTRESLTSLAKKYRYMKRTSISRWVNELADSGWIKIIQTQEGNIYQRGEKFKRWNAGLPIDVPVSQNETAKGVYQNGMQGGVPKWDKGDCTKMGHINIDSLDVEAINIEVPENEFSAQPSPSEKPKKGGKGTPGAEPWTKEAATLFDQILKGKDPGSDPYNWIAAPGRDFSALKRLKAAMLPDIERNAELKKQEVTPETITAGFSFLFSYGYDYLSEIAKSKGGPVHYTPSAILNNYNSIVNYAKRNHKPATATTTSSQRRTDADREALARLVESAHDIDF